MTTSVTEQRTPQPPPRALNGLPLWLYWFLWALFVILALTYIFVAIFALRPTHRTTTNPNNNLQANFDAGTGQIDVKEQVNPFSVLSSTRPNVIRNAVVFTDLGTLATIMPPNDSIMANTFVCNDWMNVVSVQVFASALDLSNPNRAREVAVFNFDTRELLLQSTVNFDSDFLDAGFVTHSLPESEQVLLTPFVRYAIVSTYLAGDTYVQNQDVVEPVLEMKILGQAILEGSNVISLPNASEFTPVSNTLLFGSVQLQKDVTKNQYAWMVNLGSDAFPTLPPRYLSGLNVEAQDGDRVVIEAGVCLDIDNETNMVNPFELYLSAAKTGVNGLDEGKLEGNQWYAIYLLNSTLQRLPAAGIISKNLQQPFQVPIAYNCFRRVGWARSDFIGNGFIPTFQTGNGARRQTVYRLPQFVFSHTFVSSETVPPGIPQVVDLDVITPPASSVELKISTQNNSNPRALDMLIGGTTFLAAPTGNADQTLTIPVTPIPIPHATTVTLSRTSATPTNPVQVDVYVLSFFDDI